MCTCSTKPATKGQLAARATLCHICPHADRAGPIWSGAVTCSISAKPIVHHALSGHCPSGLYGLTQSRWWIGVPAPLRWLARVLGAPAKALRLIPGCGCIRPLKLAWVRLRGRL